jgi:methionyl-tRNA formyltransferase
LKKGEEAEKVLAFLNQADPDFIVVVAYGRILPKAILDLPRLGCVNVHSSLLPAYRGAAPIQWAMARGEVITGITTMHMDEGLDTGPILLQKECEIGKNEYADTLHDRLAKMGAEVLTETLEGLFAGTLYSRSQPAEGVSYAPRIQKSDGRIDWSKSAQEIVNRIRGFYPWPGSTSQFEGSTVKIHRAHCQRPKMNGAKKKAAYPPGTVISVESEGISVQTGDNNTVVITEIQIAGAKRQKVDDFLRGHRIKVGDVF